MITINIVSNEQCDHQRIKEGFVAAIRAGSQVAEYKPTGWLVPVILEVNHDHPMRLHYLCGCAPVDLKQTDDGAVIMPVFVDPYACITMGIGGKDE
jgi:hypothetical protein